jgi:hypothetical protein
LRIPFPLQLHAGPWGRPSAEWRSFGEPRNSNRVSVALVTGMIETYGRERVRAKLEAERL